LETKLCGNCREVKNVEEFYERKDSADGRHYYCNKCSRDRRRAYYYAKKAEKKLNIIETADDIGNKKAKAEKKESQRKMREIEDIMMILIRDDWTCKICGERVNLYKENNPLKAHIDHIFPISRGGTSNWTNLQTLCRTCNLKKGAKVENTMNNTF
jgi:5-methylcytosine-specific restriction endonuclease McrA